jgi:hypothetical protein
LLNSSCRREERFERMREFFVKNGLSQRGVKTLVDVSEELVTNALYDAPVDAGYFEHHVSRTEDVDLPSDRACEISYGIDATTVFVRVRDPFGALERNRLQEVLNRCNSGEVALDESRGGAGLGLWRVFSAASTIAITVVPKTMTEMLIEFSIKDGRLVAPALHAIHLFIAPKAVNEDFLDIPTGEVDFDQSVSFVRF